MTTNLDGARNAQNVGGAAAAHRNDGRLAGLFFAFAVTALVTSEVGAMLSALIWAAAGGSFNFSWQIGVAEGITAVICVALAVIIFVRTLRVERRMARGEELDGLPWSPFARDPKNA